MALKSSFPIADLHCDLLSYLHEVPGADPAGVDDIGASLFYLQNGGVKLQVMAIYTDVRDGSSQVAKAQSKIYRDFSRDYVDILVPLKQVEDLQGLAHSEKIGMVAAIENAAGFCEEQDSLKDGFAKLDQLIDQVGPLLYISMTHHTENRFGGGNYSKAGLKPDGEALLEYLHGKRIAIDLSHTSDSLAEGIFNYTSRQNLDVPLIASHSNFRKVWDHRRNLPDEFVKEIIYRKGLIGINFLRAFVHTERAEVLEKHILYGLEKGAEDSLCFGADFFYTKNHPDKESRIPFYYKEHENATRYGEILAGLQVKGVSNDRLRKISYENAFRFVQTLWQE